MLYLEKETIKSIMLIIIGATILSFGSYNFNYQNNVTEGGVLGLLLLMQHVFNISPSITSVVIDFILFTIGSKFFGKKFLLYSILSTTTFSITYKIWESIGFLVPSFKHNMLIASILAGIGVGVGVGLVVRGGGASGGDDVIALLGNKFLVGNSPNVIINFGFNISNCLYMYSLQWLEHILRFFLSNGKHFTDSKNVVSKMSLSMISNNFWSTTPLGRTLPDGSFHSIPLFRHPLLAGASPISTMSLSLPKYTVLALGNLSTSSWHFVHLLISISTLFNSLFI